MFREWKALFLEGLPIYEDEVVYLTFYSLNSSFNDRAQNPCIVLVLCTLCTYSLCTAAPFVQWVSKTFHARFPFSVKS